MNLILLLLFLQQTLAPNPVSFVREEVPVDGTIYIVQYSNNRFSIEEKTNWRKRVIKNYLFNYISEAFKKPPNDPDDFKFDSGCLWGCSIVLIVSVLFWGGLIYLLWRTL